MTDIDLKAKVVELRAKGMDKATIARTLGTYRQKIIDICKEIESNPRPKTTGQRIAESAEKIGRDVDRKLIAREIKAVASDRALFARLELMIADSLESMPPIEPYRHSRGSEYESVETILLHLSDWHAYEIIKPERVLELNSYDGAVFESRVGRIIDAALGIKDRMEGGLGWRFPRLVIAANGDFVSGTIHDVERHTDAEDIVDAACRCGLVLSKAIGALAGAFEEVHVVCTSGNHGRLPDARRMQQKDPRRSWDSLVYKIASIDLKNSEHVKFYIPNAYTCLYEVEGWTFLQHHGHEVKSWQGIPFYGITRKVAQTNAIRQHSARPAHYALMGHFHNKGSLDVPGGEVFVGGSLCGTSEYAVGAGLHSEPTQWMFGVNQKYGVAHRWPLFAEGTARRNADFQGRELIARIG